MKSFPWNSIIDGIDEESGFPKYDRPYDAEDFRDVMQRFFSDGIFSDSHLGFGVTAGTGMTVNVEGGACMISGTNGIEDEPRILMVQSADQNNPRIDTVVLRWNSDIDERNIDLYIIQGTPSSKPSRPSLTRLKGSVWELGLCDILIPAKSTSIFNVNITDTRLDPSRCGIVTPFTEFDSTSLYKVLKAKVDEMVELTKTALDGTTAGHLQNQIDDRVKLAGDTMTGSLAVEDDLTINNTKRDFKHVIASEYYGFYGNSFTIKDKNNDRIMIIPVNRDETILQKPLTISSGGTGGKSRLEALNNLGIYYGETSTFNITNGSPQVMSFAFQNPFPRVPIVIATPEYSSSNAIVSVSVYSVSENGFNFMVSCEAFSGTVNIPVKINYIAIMPM